MFSYLTKLNVTIYSGFVMTPVLSQRYQQKHDTLHCYAAELRRSTAL